MQHSALQHSALQHSALQHSALQHLALGLVSIRSSLLLMIIYKCTKHYNYLQAYLH
jgi:hypothetical protein